MLTEFEELVYRMRSAQKRYFKTKCRTALDESKILERSIDLILEKKMPKPEPQLPNQTTMKF